MSWYLVVVLAGHVLMTPVPFDTKEACEAAGMEMVNEVEEGQCYEAGEEPTTSPEFSE
jgi:hypothetical protein